MDWTMTMNRVACRWVGGRPRRRRGGATGIVAVTVFMATLLGAGKADAQVFSTLRAFSGDDGSSPSAALVEGSDGTFYGTTQLGGHLGFGTVYGMTAEGALTMVYELSGIEGSDVFAPLLVGRDGQLYGTTALGGPGGSLGGLDGKGAIFTFSPSGSYTALHFFSAGEGTIPQSGLTEEKDGRLYGTTSSGGEGGEGTIFAITPQGEFCTLHSFAGSDGSMPLGELVVGREGMLYGTTVAGGPSQGGTVFRIAMDGQFTLLHSFGFDSQEGSSPRGRLALGADGDFYGTTEFGGEYGNGQVFRLAFDGTVTPLHSFTRFEGTNPLAGLIQGNDGIFYGTTSSGGLFNNGSVFAITMAGELSVLHAFTGGADGGSPVSALLQARNGRLYGTTPLGGAESAGTVFRIALSGPAKAVPNVQFRSHVTEEDVVLTLPSAAKDVTLTITARRTPGLRWARPFPTTIRRMAQACRVEAETVVCTFGLHPGAWLSPGKYTFSVLLGAGERVHDVHMDTFELTYASDHQVYAQAGRF